MRERLPETGVVRFYPTFVYPTIPSNPSKHSYLHFSKGFMVAQDNSDYVYDKYQYIISFSEKMN